MAFGVRVTGGRSLRRPARAREDLWTGLLCLGPAVLLTLAFIVGPILFSLYVSFHEWAILLPARRFVGLANYQRLLHSAELRLALRNTALYALGVVLGGSGLSLLLAAVLNGRPRGWTVYRMAYFVPAVISTVAAAVVWTWLYNPHYGPINHLLRRMGLPTCNWLADPHWALPAITLVGIWKNTGYQMMVFLAALQGIPRAYHDAASIDGANGLQRFWHVTWPLLRPATAFVLTTNAITSCLAFGPVYVMTGGGPMGSTTLLVYLVYRRAFEMRQMGDASAIAWVLFLLLLLLAIVQHRYGGLASQEAARMGTYGGE